MFQVCDKHLQEKLQLRHQLPYIEGLWLKVQNKPEAVSPGHQCSSAFEGLWAAKGWQALARQLQGKHEGAREKIVMNLKSSQNINMPPNDLFVGALCTAGPGIKNGNNPSLKTQFTGLKVHLSSLAQPFVKD